MPAERRHFLFWALGSMMQGLPPRGQTGAAPSGDRIEKASMRLVTYTVGPLGPARAGVRVGHRVLDIEGASRVQGEPLPDTMRGVLQMGRGALARVQALAKAAQSGAGRYAAVMHEEKAVRFLPPVPDPDKFLCVG